MYIASDIRMKIEDCLTRNNRPMTATEIVKELGDVYISTQRMTAILKTMTCEGSIEKHAIVNHNKYYMAYTHNDYEEIIIDYEIANRKEKICFIFEEFFNRITTVIEKSVDFLILYWYN